MSLSVRPPSWLAYVALATLILGSTFQAGIVSRRIDDLNERMLKVEAQNDQIHAIDIRTTRIETKVDDLRTERRP